jgi:osmotically-inducible protein OsmY
MRFCYTIAAVMLAAAALTGCAGVFVAGAAAGASVAYDRRTVGTQLDDQTIEIEATNAIYHDKPLYDSSHLIVVSFNKIVLLAGQTPTETMRAHAARVVSAVPDVRKVYNEVTIGEPTSFMTRSNDAALTTKVKGAMLAAPDVDAFRVKVVTENGTVFLMGLAYRREAEAAARVASQVGGVQRVVKLFEYLD